MDIQEYLLDKAEKLEIAKGIEKGMGKGEREKAIAIAFEFKKWAYLQQVLLREPDFPLKRSKN
ncbi:hypothetical protein ACFX5U_12820 [Sphingobacterium sp. SG20118]|uniref:hypothetical protein n=1 Tax=Sphingobacterium sp. SG20118 TaxID=3367156 RepID=UPI0037DFBF51